jgi:hypothetical protein
MTGRDIRSGNLVASAEAEAIKALPPLPEGRKKWAKLIVQLTLSGRYWARPDAMKPAGDIYEAIKQSAVRNRLRKAISRFQQHYEVLNNNQRRGVSPREFLRLSEAQKLAVIDKSERAGDEPLDNVKSTHVAKKAETIMAMVPTQSELTLELTAVVEDRLKTVLRN